MDHGKQLPGCFGSLFTRKSRPLGEGLTQQPVSRFPTEQKPKCMAGGKKTKEEMEEISYFSPCCDFSFGSPSSWWTQPEELPSYSPIAECPRDNSISAIIDLTFQNLNHQLRDLSLKIHSHPELMFQERYAHDLLSNFMADHGFTVTRHYHGLDTAWKAEYSQGTGGRVIGINSEMDALSGIGHACGHNLIAISGVGIAVALKAALRANQAVSGKIILLGTPEEGGGGKVILLERGAYSEMDACIMCHPGPGAPHSVNIGPSTAMQAIEVEYFGRSAHAGAAPWEGTNALDAAFLAYSGISLLRQQIKPDHRVHGIIQGKSWQPNVIPDYSKMRWLVRAPTSVELVTFVERVTNCLKAAALATSCKIAITVESPYFDLHQNHVLAQDFSDIAGTRYGLITVAQGTSASTDFGNVSYALPALHPNFAIPTEPQGGNHTPAFTKAAISEQAHAATIVISKGLALTGYRVLSDTAFYSRVKASFSEQSATSYWVSSPTLPDRMVLPMA